MGSAFTILGLVIDAIGAFFLSVEAIKPQNLKQFVESAFRALHHGLMPGVYAGTDGKSSFGPLPPTSSPATAHDTLQSDVGPPTSVGARPRTIQLTAGQGNWARRHPLLFELFHGVWGIALFAGIVAIAHAVLGDQLRLLFGQATSWLISQQWYVVALVAFLSLPASFAIIWGGLGEVGHRLTMLCLRVLVSFLQFLQERCADGLVGTIGFLLLMLGFGLQIAGTLLTAG